VPQKLSMQTHEHFEELCALAAIGQLSAEEYAELLAHMRACDQCKRTEDDFALILGQLPMAEPPNVSGDTEELLSESLRQKFLERAVAEGARFSDEVLRPRRTFSLRLLGLRSQYPQLAIAAVVLSVIIACGFAAALFYWTGRILVRPSMLRASQPATRTDTAPSQPADSHTEMPEQKPAAATLEPHNDDSERKVSFLQQQLVQAIEEKRRGQVELDRLKQQLALLEAHSAKNEQALSEANTEVEQLKKGEATTIAAMVERENKINELSNEVIAQASAAERERQLSMAANDVRKLMGARNLHIIDVYDFDGRGKRDKSFGRVFYTEAESLIFYAFDLTQKDPGSKVTFQAWGQREGGGTFPRNLGVFHIDDGVQKRWVLRVDDPKLLSSIDSVFVTVEPAPGRDKPSGKKLLYAYLGTQANHP
jgi:hypothetical protein